MIRMDAANIVHDLLNPLNVIVGYSEILIEDAVSQGRVQDEKDLKRIHSAAKLLQEKIDQLAVELKKGSEQ